MIRTLSLVLLTAMLAACATLWLSQEERLRQRVVGFWDALKANDLVAMYGYEELSRNPQASLQKYVQSKGGIRYLSYKIQSIRILNPDEAEVSLEVEYLVPPAIQKPIKSKIRDRWVKIGGTWYHALRKPGS
ncbi:hypothetical protein JCM13664_13020 [Methylothermus subterraneus]